MEGKQSDDVSSPSSFSSPPQPPPSLGIQEEDDDDWVVDEYDVLPRDEYDVLPQDPQPSLGIQVPSEEYDVLPRDPQPSLGIQVPSEEYDVVYLDMEDVSDVREWVSDDEVERRLAGSVQGQPRSDTDVHSPSPSPRKKLTTSTDASATQTKIRLGTPLHDTHVGMLFNILQNTSAKWYDIGLGLNILPGELDNIQGNPLLLATAPKSCLRQVLVDYTKKSTANLEDLCQAVRDVGEQRLALALPQLFHEAMTAQLEGEHLQHKQIDEAVNIN